MKKIAILVLSSMLIGNGINAVSHHGKECCDSLRKCIHHSAFYEQEVCPTKAHHATHHKKSHHDHF